MIIFNYTYIYMYIYIPVVPHKAVAEVSKIGNLYERLVVVNQGWQSEATDGPKGALGLLSFALFLWLSTYLPIYFLCIYLSIYLSLFLSFNYPIYLSIYLFPKVVRAWCALYILTWKCASRHNGVHFFDIWTSKSGPSMVCFVHFDLEMCFAPQRRALFQHLNFQKWSGTEVFCTFWLRNVLRATTACTFSTSQLPKVVRAWCALYILTSKCASRHNGVHFFDISTSKSGPSMVCFVHFDLEMCFAPQRRALFRHLNFQKWSENGVFCTFWLGNVLRATTAYTFFNISTSKSGPELRCFVHFDCKCASRHNGVHFFNISTSKSGPELRCFVHFDLQMCFAPQRRAIFHLSSGQLAPRPPL